MGLRSGSSPLARGLRDIPHEIRQGGRIIPARAGFTHRYGDPARWAEDHPRSRGVYRRRRWPLSRRTDHPRSRGVY